MYLCSGLLLFYILQWTADWIWGYFVKFPNELYITIGSAIAALVTGIVMYRHERVYALANEVAAELKKVAWPGPKDVRQATIVVIIMTIISASILGFFDYVWANVTQFIYG